MVGDRETLVLYTTATCNLNCSYCYIDKNRSLVEIDSLLDQSFCGDYYETFIQEMFPDKNQLRSLETWGGEPFLRMDRIHETLRRIIPRYPNLSNFFSSTNMAFENWTDQFFELMDVFGAFQNRRFSYCLQISLDGPESFTDLTRGKGTTAKVLDNFGKMLQQVGDRLPANINLMLQFKPTLNVQTMRMLDSRAAIERYYRFFDDLVDQVRRLNYTNITITEGIPNMACPSLSTQEDGKYFARICRTTREMEKESLFRHYKILTPFSHGATGDIKYTLRYKNFTCGTGFTVLGLLPGHLISTCHNGFVDVVSDYKKLSNANNGSSTIDAKIILSEHKHRMVFHKDEYAAYENQMACFNCEGTSARLASIATQIVMLAYAGQILPLYKDFTEAKKAAIFYQSHTSFCVRDNHATTGSLTTIHNGLLKLLFNGAHCVIEDGSVNWT